VLERLDAAADTRSPPPLDDSWSLTGDLSETSTRRALVGCLAHLAASPASLVMADLEDLWLENEPQNRPGTGEEAGNFKRRAKRTLEEAQADPDVTEMFAEIDRLRRTNDTGGKR
jgi:4-alpha-glucanotransferase